MATHIATSQYGVNDLLFPSVCEALWVTCMSCEKCYTIRFPFLSEDVASVQPLLKSRPKTGLFSSAYDLTDETANRLR